MQQISVNGLVKAETNGSLINRYWQKCEGGNLRKKIAAGALDELEVLGSDEACLHSLTMLSTLSESEKTGIREIPIRC